MLNYNKKKCCQSGFDCIFIASIVCVCVHMLYVILYKEQRYQIRVKFNLYLSKVCSDEQKEVFEHNNERLNQV